MHPASNLADHPADVCHDCTPVTCAGGTVLRLAPWLPGGTLHTSPDDMHSLYRELAGVRGRPTGDDGIEPPPAA